MSRADRSPETVLTALAIAGLAAPVVFVTAIVVQGLLRPEYSHVTEPVSALAAGKHGWVQSLVFEVVGLLWVAFAIGLHRGVRRNGASGLGPVLLAVAGAGMLGAGIFPGLDSSGRFVAAPPHPAMAALAFGGAALGLAAISRRFAKDEKWRGHALLCLVGGIAVLAVFATIVAFAKSPDAPLRDWLGLLQWVAVTVWFGCLFVVAWRLLRLARLGIAGRG